MDLQPNKWTNQELSDSGLNLSRQGRTIVLRVLLKLFLSMGFELVKISKLYWCLVCGVGNHIFLGFAPASSWLIFLAWVFVRCWLYIFVYWAPFLRVFHGWRGPCIEIVWFLDFSIANSQWKRSSNLTKLMCLVKKTSGCFHVLM